MIAFSLCIAGVPTCGADCYEDVIVVGAGSGEANGTYVFDGMNGGRPYFVKGVATYVDWNGAFWMMLHNGTHLYSNDSQDDLPPPSGWYAVNGSNPPPTLSGGHPCCQGPTLSGMPPSSVTAGASYGFSPSVSKGCPPLRYSIAGKPSWASFSSTSGTLSGTPGGSDVGIYEGVTITVRDAEANTDTVGPFAIVVEIGGIEPAGAGDTASFLDVPLTPAEGEEPPMIGSLPLAAIFEIGEPITGGCRLLDAHGGAILGAYVKVELYRVTLGTPEKLKRVASLIVRHDEASNCYRFEIETDELTPGTYDVRLVFPDGSAEILRVKLVAPST